MAKKKISIVSARCIGDCVYVEFSDQTSMAFSAEFLRRHGESLMPNPSAEIHLVKHRGGALAGRLTPERMRVRESPLVLASGGKRHAGGREEGPSDERPFMG